MDDIIRVSSSEFGKEVGRYQDAALSHPVVVSRNGRDRTVIISIEEYRRLKYRDRQVMGLDDFADTDIRTVKKAKTPASRIMAVQDFPNDHNRLDERSLALHKLIAKKLKADPSLVEIAKDNIQRWGTTDRPALKEWKRLLKKRVGYIISFLQERSENATRLRQSSPFAGILSEGERLRIYEAYRSRSHY